MAITESHLEALLLETAPDEAVHSLMNAWMPRYAERAPRFGLSHAEYFSTLCLIYTDDVRNDGHRQFFLSRGGAHIPATVDALDALNLTAARQILVDACGVFPGARVPAAPVDVEFFFDECFQSVFDLLFDLDRRLSALPVHERVLAFLRTHQDDLLLPERPLRGR